MIESAEIGSLSVIVPCLNEQENIIRYEKELIGFFRTFTFTTDFVFIDDGSTDQTACLLKELGQRHQGITIIHHSEPKGLGRALRQGFLECRGQTILTLDADLTFDPQDFQTLAQAYHENVDCVSGSALRGRFCGVSIIRRLLSVGVNHLYSTVLGDEIESASSMFRLYRKSSLLALDLKCHHFDINAEIMAKMVLAGYRVVEVAVNLSSRIGGQSKVKIFREIKNHLIMLVKIMVWKKGIGSKQHE